MSRPTLDDWARGRPELQRELSLLRESLASERQAKIERGELLVKAEQQRDRWRTVAERLMATLHGRTAGHYRYPDEQDVVAAFEQAKRETST